MRKSLETILSYAIGTVPQMCMGFTAIVLSDTSIPVEERIQFLNVVLDASPDDTHRQELEELLAVCFDECYFADVRTVLVQIAARDSITEG